MAGSKELAGGGSRGYSDDLTCTRLRELEAELQEKDRINSHLASTNRELEAFAHSVAHDLRAPLRAIDGFSRILERRSGQHLDAEAKANLGCVRDGVKRMQDIIDGLLRLSYCGCSGLGCEEVDLAALAKHIVADLRQRQPERQVEFAVAESLPAKGDPVLIAVMLENLLINAWKYTREREAARVELGCVAERPIYFVRDNGAGFDMAYAGRLFKPFQRLHSVSQFEGSGIGLSIVHRIVERHGGRVWAEAEVDRGATIYFTLAGTTE